MAKKRVREMKKMYRWKPGAEGRIKCPPLRAYEEMLAAQALAKKRGEKFGTTHLVEVARKRRSPLHSWFEWDDTLAAASHRLQQAGYLIRSLEITVAEVKQGKVVNSQTLRQWTSLGKGDEDGKDSGFHDTREVLSDAELRKQVVLKIWRQLLNLKRQYDDYQEFAAVWSAVDGAADSIADDAADVG